MTTRDDIPPCTCHVHCESKHFAGRSGADPNVGCLRHPNAGSNSGQTGTAAQLEAEHSPPKRVLFRGIANDASQFFRDEEPERPTIWENRR